MRRACTLFFFSFIVSSTAKRRDRNKPEIDGTGEKHQRYDFLSRTFLRTTTVFRTSCRWTMSNESFYSTRRFTTRDPRNVSRMNRTDIRKNFENIIFRTKEIYRESYVKAIELYFSWITYKHDARTLFFIKTLFLHKTRVLWSIAALFLAQDYYERRRNVRRLDNLQDIAERKRQLSIHDRPSFTLCPACFRSIPRASCGTKTDQRENACNRPCRSII